LKLSNEIIDPLFHWLFNAKKCYRQNNHTHRLVTMSEFTLMSRYPDIAPY